MARDHSKNTERKRWNRKKWLGAFVLIVISGCFVAAVWFVWQLRNYDPFSATIYQPFPTDSYELSAIEGNAGIILPPSARDIYAYTTGFQDVFIQMRFSMSASELDEFLKSTLCQEPLKQMVPDPQPASEGNFDWWVPDQAEHLEGCTRSSDHSYQTIMVDMTDPDVYVVFVSTGTY